MCVSVTTWMSVEAVKGCVTAAPKLENLSVVVVSTLSYNSTPNPQGCEFISALHFLWLNIQETPAAGFPPVKITNTHPIHTPQHILSGKEMKAEGRSKGSQAD